MQIASQKKLNFCPATSRCPSLPPPRRLDEDSLANINLPRVPTAIRAVEMGKLRTPKRNGSSSTPYDRPTVKNNVFKFNTNVGQHILKNPAIAAAIVEVRAKGLTGNHLMRATAYLFLA